MDFVNGLRPTKNTSEEAKKPCRRWYRWLPIVLAFLSVGGGWLAFKWKAEYDESQRIPKPYKRVIDRSKGDSYWPNDVRQTPK